MFKKIYGHKKNIKFLRKSYGKNFPQSWIFYGKKGVGKFLTAQVFSKWIIERNYIKNDYFESNKGQGLNIEGKFLSNIFEFNTDESKLSLIDDVRDLIKELLLTNMTNEKKIIIIDNFDFLNLNSINALLKNLEEPRNQILIIIICHNIFKIPKTVLSRCQTLKFNSLTESDFLNFNKDNPSLEINTRNYNLFDLCDGRPGLLKFIGQINIIKIFEDIDKLIDEKKIDYEKLYGLSDIYKKNPHLIDYLIKSYLYTISKNNLLKNINDLEHYHKIVNFFSLLNKQENFNLNFDIRNYVIYLFLGFLKTLKD